MEVIDQFHTPAALSLGKEPPRIHWIGGWVVSRAVLDVSSVGNEDSLLVRLSLRFICDICCRLRRLVIFRVPKEQRFLFGTQPTSCMCLITAINEYRPV